MSKLGSLVLLLMAIGCGGSIEAPAEPSRPKPTLVLTVFGKGKVVLLRPQTVVLVGRLNPDADLSDFECAAIEWTVPGETGSLNQPMMNCEGIQVVFQKYINIYHYGVHRPRLRLINPYTGKVLAQASVEIEIVRPEE